MNIIDRLQDASAPYIKMLRIKHQTIGTIVYVLGLLDANFFQVPTIVFVFIGVMLISLAGFLINDYVDAKDTDKFSYRKRAATDTKIDSKIVWTIWTILNLAGAIIMIRYGLWLQAIIFILINTAYSVPPLRLKSRFFWDLLVTLIQGGIGFYSLGFSLSGQNVLLALLSPPFIVLFFFLASGWLILATMDVDSDTKGGLKNTGVVLGYKWLIRLNKIFLIISALTFAILFYQHKNWWYYPLIAVLPYFGYAVGRLRQATEQSKDLRSLLNITYTRAMTTMVLVTIYLVIVFTYGLLRYYALIPKL